MRTRLPNRRESVVINVPHPMPGSVVEYAVTIGGVHGQPFEVFLTCNKTTTALAISGLEIATLISIALQHGASIKELAAAMPREKNGEPQGAAGAVLDAVILETQANEVAA